MATLTIPDETLAAVERAAAARGVPVATWLADRAAADPAQPAGPPPGDAGRRPVPQGGPEWRRRFDAMMANVRSWNPDVDDSREAIYAARGRDESPGASGPTEEEP